MSGTGMQTFDPSALREKVVDRVRDTFVDLITPEQWEAMVSKVIDDFAKVPEPGDRRYKHGGPNTSLLIRIIGEEVEVLFRELVRAELASSNYASQWNVNGTTNPAPMVKGIVAELAPVLVQGMFGTMVQELVERLRVELDPNNPNSPWRA